ncbi:MarR family winged helix-turn-helix transcriptional regulator [Flagellimonas myxillae]|uniref:MarR family winged helix-turn-helix transcriptional regulator n=1 Tax=Flagellimonas myxillae TaxID=2942214 RepID=UPI00201E7968|nr:MarR family transcriptional regulator [Muricauda myxillae]MCL6265902.1 MarR family transcriptional regulator [Muricauda myxillae]
MNSYYQAIFEIIKTGHWITDAVSRELREYDIYEPQFNVLRILEGAKSSPVSVNYILENMVQRSSNVTRIVDKLESKGLVERTLCSEDRRKMDISITEEGSELLKKLNKRVGDFHKPMLNNLTPEEAKTLKQLILKLKGQ